MTVPDVLVLHLNRSSGGTRKVGSYVDTPLYIDLRRWAKTRGKGGGEGCSTVYNLVAIIFHSGQSSSSGHYTCYARTPVLARSASSASPSSSSSSSPPPLGDHDGPREWAFYDDETVEFVTEERVRAMLSVHSDNRATAYILFYEREKAA
jgi:ubiquitin C-terminal hydrolase